MIFTKEADKKDLHSETCGLLTEYLSNQDVPISITVVKDIKPTKSHVHKTTTEIYWIRDGSINVLINDSDEITLEKGDSLVIEPGELHEVTKASEVNEVVVLCNPPWNPEDVHTGIE